MRRSIAAGFIAVVVLGLLVVPAWADVILSGNFEGDGVLTPTGTPGVFAQNLTGDGEDATLGAFTIQSQSTIDFSSPPTIVISDGTLSLVFPGGTLLGTSSGTGTASGQGTATFDLDVVFTGGTGIFAGRTGAATVTGTITQTSPTTETVEASYSGSLSAIPEPSSLTVFALGVSAVMGILTPGRRRAKREGRMAGV